MTLFVWQVGLDVTHSVVMQGQQLTELKGRGRFGDFLHQISRFYLQYHRCARAVLKRSSSLPELTHTYVEACCALCADMLFSAYVRCSSHMRASYASFHLALPRGTVPCPCRDSYGTDAIYVHDPTAMAAVLAPELFTWCEGEVRVVTSGVAAGHTILDRGLKQWNEPNAWTGRPKAKVAVGVQSEAVVKLMWGLMSAHDGDLDQWQQLDHRLKG